MSRSLWMVLLSGCGSSWQGMWLLTIPYVDDQDACATTVTENYNDGNVPDEPDSLGPWTYGSVFEASDSLLVLEIVEADGKNVVVALRDQLYPGTIDGKLLKVSWTERTVDNISEVHQDGYTFLQDTTTETIETLTLNLNPEIDGANGSFDVTTNTTLAWTETDEWDYATIYVGNTQIPSFLYLEGAGNFSDPAVADCTGGNCELAVVIECDLGADVKALAMGRDRDGAYAALENAGR